MYTIKEWTAELDLTDFYTEAARRGFVNNASKKDMIDCFRNEREWNAWILYRDNKAVGSVAAHSFDEVMGPGSYRVMTRVCIMDNTVSQGLTTARRAITQHQNLTDQFLLPKCIEWAGREKLYATSNASKKASQRLVHSIYFPALEKIGVVTKIKDVHYRHTDQTVWQINVDEFEKNLNRYPRW